MFVAPSRPTSKGAGVTYRPDLDLGPRQRFDSVFPNVGFETRPAALVVVHVTDVDQARRNADIAVAAGADGLFVIDHGNGCDLAAVRAAIVRDHPRLWVGMNRLDLLTGSALRAAAEGDADGLWADDGGIDPDDAVDDEPRAAAFVAERIDAGFLGLYFAGVAFKYQKHAADPGAVARRSVEYCDVICTSGPGTGQAAEVEKLSAMRAAIGDHPLAVASGVTPENLHEIRRIVDAVLVATGISTSFTELDPSRCAALVAATAG